MIKLGKLTDYAIAVMGQLAQENADASCSAHYLSGKTGVPEPTVAKVLKLLSKGGLVSSVRGAAGGYKLAKTADQVPIADIITTMDGPIAIVSCVDGQQEACEMWETCPTRGNWGHVNEAIKTALEGVKLTQMLTPACSKAEIMIKDMNVNRA